MNIFYGTYGFDFLSIFLLILSTFFNFDRYPRIVSVLLIIIVIYRAFSKNIYKRSSELSKFISIINKVLGKFGKGIPYNLPRIGLEGIPAGFGQIKYNISQKRKFKIVKCPNCSQKLRLPRGQKKIIVTCKKCSHEFKMKT
ncbi:MULTISPECIES: hypothetical protein [Clostridium]|uniref:Zn-finger containing protein n=1 Tax=Clostridium cibarium TaxID=2762247 RepID=A0ABR8PYF4_9CLOT|nr:MULTISPECIES: hypothetical protein [Clostridium]MBD7913204.1 hypothetical protein [Clostridium cibarium]